MYANEINKLPFVRTTPSNNWFEDKLVLGLKMNWVAEIYPYLLYKIPDQIDKTNQHSNMTIDQRLRQHPEMVQVK